MTKIIIAGAGFGGVRAALDLSKNLPNEKITLVNDSPYHCFHADLYEVAATVLQKEQKMSKALLLTEFKNLSGTVNIPLKKIFKDKHVELLVDNIVEVDLEGNTIKTKISGNLGYDFIILGLGSESNYYRIEGAKDFSHPLKTAEDAINIRNDLDELVFRSNKPISVVIAGGGLTGVELAGALVTYLKDLSSTHHQTIVNLKIVEGGGDVLPGMPNWAQKLTLKKFKSLGLEVHLDKKIKKVKENKIECEDGSQIEFDYLIWTAGVKGANLEGRIKGVSFTKRGKIETLQNLSLEKFPNVFVIGDLAQCLDKVRGVSVAATAWAATGQGKIAAKNIAAKIKGQPLDDYVPPSPVFVVPVGRKFALSNFAGLKITGVIGWLLKRMIALKYFLSILPFFDALSTWRKGVTIYLAND